MSDKEKKALVNLIIDMSFFLEFSDEERLDPDLAVEMMEAMSWHLKEINDIEKSELSNLMREQSRNYKDAERESFVFNLPESLGLE